jgi:RNA polymerase sigma factor (sigma-70 family)
MSTPHSDQQYIEALVQNDPVLLNELYRRYSGKIKGMVLKNSGTEQDAADVFQEGLIALYQKASTGKFVLTCPLDAFLYTICRNKWINEINKRKGTGVTFTDTEGYSIDDDTFKSAEQVMQHHQRRELLEEKFAQLGEGCRELLELSWGGRAMEEVAGLLNITYAYVRKKKSECMGKLVELVKGSALFETLKW